MNWERGKFYIARVGTLLAPWSRKKKVDARSKKERSRLGWSHYNRAKVMEGQLSDDGLYGIHFHGESDGLIEYVLTHIATGASLHRGTEEECKARAVLFADTIKAYHAEHEGKSEIPAEPLGALLKAKIEERDIGADLVEDMQHARGEIDLTERKIQIPTRRRRRLT